MIKKIFLAGTAVIMLSGCQTVLTKELRHSGGYPGYLLDKRTFDGSESKDVQLFRMTMLLAMAARLGSEEIDNGDDADAFLKYLESAVKEVNYAAANIRPVKEVKKEDGTTEEPAGVVCAAGKENLTGKDCSGYYSNFQSDLPLVEKRMFSLVLNALPDENAAEFVEDAISGDVFGAAVNALQASLDAVEGVHQVAAIYRSAQEVVASELSINGKNDPNGCGKIKKKLDGSASLERVQQGPFKPETGSTSDAVNCLGLSDLIWSKNPYEVKGEDLNFTFKDTSFDSMMRIVRTSCAALPIVHAGGASINDQVKARNELCGGLKLEPKARPTQLSP